MKIHEQEIVIKYIVDPGGLDYTRGKYGKFTHEYIDEIFDALKDNAHQTLNNAEKEEKQLKTK